MLPFSKCKSFTSFAASGAEALAAGDYNVQRCEVEEPIREAIEGTIVHKDQVQNVSDGYMDTLMDTAKPEDILEHENSDLKDEVKILHCSLDKLEEELRDTNRMHVRKLTEQEQKLQKSKVLWYQSEETKDILEQENSNLKDEVKILHCSLDKLEEELRDINRINVRKLTEQEQKLQKSQVLWYQSEETKYILEHENSNLKDEVKILHCSLDKLEEELRDTNRMHVRKLTEQEQKLQKSQVLWYQSEETKDILEQENSNLKDEVKTLQASVEKLERQLHETQKFNEEILNEQYREQQKHITLLSMFAAIKSEAQEKALNAIAQIENEKFALRKQLGILHSLEGCATEI
ncbi:tropomyosin-like isoform X1 [Ictalurus furcatus]|uniref:tropomyosin-like isoform X1 n=1 Tax=Ictalurus furcatus TaxID=66913 RepID=UPI0023501C83|nr:tropomyosin-like isoform X1 [Ictalurus furcatus]